MLTQDKIDQFYKDLESLQLSRPGSTIVEKTGLSKGNISAYLRKKKKPSKNFIDAFYKAFKDDLLKKQEQAKNEVNEDEALYITARKETVKYVPISAQAGYAHSDASFQNRLERFVIPGFPFKGEQFCFFEVKGDSMEPEYKEGDILICEKVDLKPPLQIAEYYPYIIVFQTDIILRRLAIKGTDQYVAHSEHKEFYRQSLVQRKDIKELWQVKRKMQWELPVGKKFKIEI